MAGIYFLPTRFCLFTYIIICACFVTCYSKILYCFDFEVTRISFFGFFVILFSYLSLSLFEGFEKSFLEVEELA